MNIPFLDLRRQFLDIDFNTEKILEEVLNGDQFILGEQVARFEEEFADYLKIKHCISCGNGTDALEMALQVSGIGHADEVIVPGFGWVSPYTAVVSQGAHPVLSEVDPVTGNVTAEMIASRLTPKTRAVIVIHLFGNPCEIEPIRTLCDSKGLILIEDCAQAHGAEVGDKKLGTFGDLSIFSFYPTKNLGALGDAGAIVTENNTWNHELRRLRNYGRSARHQFQYAGRNSRMDEFQAAVLRKKLPHLNDWNDRRRQIAHRYFDTIASLKPVVFEDSVYYVFPIRVRDRDRFIEKLNNSGIATDIHYPFTISGAFGLPDAMGTNATHLSEHLVSLPIFPQLSEVEISYICDHLKILEHYIL